METALRPDSVDVQQDISEYPSLGNDGIKHCFDFQPFDFHRFACSAIFNFYNPHFIQVFFSFIQFHPTFHDVHRLLHFTSPLIQVLHAFACVILGVVFHWPEYMCKLNKAML